MFDGIWFIKIIVFLITIWNAGLLISKVVWNSTFVGVIHYIWLLDKKRKKYMVNKFFEWGFVVTSTYLIVPVSGLNKHLPDWLQWDILSDLMSNVYAFFGVIFIALSCYMLFERIKGKRLDNKLKQKQLKDETKK